MKTVKQKKKLSPEEKRKLLKRLIYEKKNGKPIYYRNYKKVLSGELPWEAVMGSGYLQWRIIEVILGFLFRNLDLKKFAIATNEAGFFVSEDSWRNLDIAIFDREKLKEYEKKEYEGYVRVPPEVVIEVDTKADLEKYGDMLFYIMEKTEDLLKAGVKKVIWYMTPEKKVLVAEQNKKWYISNWDEEVEIIDGVIFNLEKELS